MHASSPKALNVMHKADLQPHAWALTGGRAFNVPGSRKTEHFSKGENLLGSRLRV